MKIIKISCCAECPYSVSRTYIMYICAKLKKFVYINLIDEDCPLQDKEAK